MIAVLQKDRTLNTELDFTRPGFIMAPFHSDKAPGVFLRPDVCHYCKFKPGKGPLIPAEPIPNPTGREIHMNLVREAKKLIGREEVRKVVVSRRFSVPFSTDLLSLAFGMVQAYPDAFGYLFHHPEVGTWLGATPEVLLKTHSGVGETIALAGTRSSDPLKEKYHWTSKEHDEQEVVTEFILNRMKAMGLKPKVGPVHNVRAGKLWHLGTSIQAPLPTGKVEKLLGMLHPTPAVCGLPTDRAYSFLSENENYNREYYTGFIGEVGIEQPGSFETYVNLRCMQVRNGRAYIYTGGGITADSDPESEWEETQQKSTTMLSLLENF